MSDLDSRSGWSSILLVGILLATAAGLGILGILSPSMRGAEPAVATAPAPSDSSLDVPLMARDIRIRAILEGYGALIDSVTYLDDDVVFQLPGGPVFFQGGRLLGQASLGKAQDYDPIFYPYPLFPLRAPIAATDEPRNSRDFLEGLFGTTEEEIRAQGVSAEFLNRRVFVNAFCLQALKKVEEKIDTLAATDPEVRTWVRNIEIAYSFIDKEIAGTRGRSHHAFGMAIDLIPTSYGGKHVYWRWSRVFNRESWAQIPVEERWSPPQAVIEAFESHGFVWGGKWPRFDTIHFEYRPEILAYNRMMREALP